jgi:YbbR domain-containing protein
VLVTPTDKSDSSVLVTGKRHDLIEYSDKISLIVDVSGIDAPGEYELDGTVRLPNSRLSIERETTDAVSVKVEKLSEKNIPIETEQIGIAKRNLIKSESDISSVKVTGAESELESITAATAEIDVTNILSDCTVRVALMPRTENGLPLSKDSTIVLSQNFVNVNNTVYTKTTLPVKLKLSSKLEKDYWLNEKDSTCSVSSVEVGILPDCDVSCVYASITTTSEDAADFKLIEEEGMYIPEQSATVRVKPSISARVTKTVDMNISADNVPEGLEALFNTTVSAVTVSAPEDALNSGSISGKIDLAGMSIGEYTVEVKPSNDRILLPDKLYVTVNID